MIVIIGRARSTRNGVLWPNRRTTRPRREFSRPLPDGESPRPAFGGFLISARRCRPPHQATTRRDGSTTGSSVMEQQPSEHTEQCRKLRPCAEEHESLIHENAGSSSARFRVVTITCSSRFI